MINAVEVKKELYKTKANAKFSHYSNGNLYYTVGLLDGAYQFPVSTVDPTKILTEDDIISGVRQEYFLSADLGMTSFLDVIQGSALNRWIAKAIETDNFVKIN